MKILKNNKGVTLAELLAVITIMGIIAAIAIPAVGRVITGARLGAAESDAIAIYESARIYCTIEDCSSGLTETELGAYLDGGVEGTYVVTVANSKPTLVTYTITPISGSGIVTYSSAGVIAWTG